MMRRSFSAAMFFYLLVGTIVIGGEKAARNPVVEESVDISPVWSGHRVGFFLLTEGV